MIFRSIRLRLALSFAGIALVAAVVLGTVLLAILRSYYSELELAYLRGNAKAVSGLVMDMTSGNASHDAVQSQIENLAFLSQTRIQVYSSQKQLLYDSGSPQNIGINLGVQKQMIAQSKGDLPQGLLRVFSITGSVSQSAPAGPTVSQAGPDQTPLSAQPKPNTVFIARSGQGGGNAFAFYLNGAPVVSGDRSSAAVAMPLNDPQNSELGNVVLSEGPAYGSEVLRNVARGWALASAIGILLAALMGWFISQRISAPVLALTDATARMARGDLTSRAQVRSQDEIGQLGRSFNEMADQVEGTVTTLRRFVSDASHELRTPLTALRTNLDLALDERNTGNREDYLRRAQAMVLRLEELNTNLLDLSRLEANGHAREMETLDLAEVLRARVEIYASQAEQAGLTMDASVPSVPMLVRADASQITRAMDNLVDNACKFTPYGGAVRVALSAQDEEVRFSVTDSGIGIPADELPQIFNRFHRGRNTNEYAGSGLGLAIVRAIVTAHGGQVDARSAGEGQGSEFVIHLPEVAPDHWGRSG